MASALVAIDDLGHADDGITHVTARFGYMEDPNAPAALVQTAARSRRSRVDVENASYFLSTVSIYAGRDSVMPRWQQRLFLATSRLTTDADNFRLPRDQTVVMGSRLRVVTVPRTALGERRLVRPPCRTLWPG